MDHGFDWVNRACGIAAVHNRTQRSDIGHRQQALASKIADSKGRAEDVIWNLTCK
jgi:hypothetical protein